MVGSKGREEGKKEAEFAGCKVRHFAWFGDMEGDGVVESVDGETAGVRDVGEKERFVVGGKEEGRTWRSWV